MTPRDALAEGRLADAIAQQGAVVRDAPGDAAARLFLFELFTLAGRLTEAIEQLRAIDSDDPDWPRARREFTRLLQAEYRRAIRGRRPTFLAEPTRHARWRWAAIRAARTGDPARAAHRVDRADAAAPLITGHVDGREFEGLRDTDDRFGSVLEVFVGAEYAWVPFEHLRRVALDPPAGVLDTVFRPARLWLLNGTEFRTVLPLVYPGSAAAGDEFALGFETDWPESGGLVCGVGARVLMIGEEELPLGECRRIEFR
jgi:type VI secretion system protein ImpE